MAQYTFFTNPMSRGQIARWALHEVGADYDTELVDWANKPAGLTEANPLGKVPTLVHHHGTAQFGDPCRAGIDIIDGDITCPHLACAACRHLIGQRHEAANTLAILGEGPVIHAFLPRRLEVPPQQAAIEPRRTVRVHGHQFVPQEVAVIVGHVRPPSRPAVRTRRRSCASRRRACRCRRPRRNFPPCAGRPSSCRGWRRRFPCRPR